MCVYDGPFRKCHESVACEIHIPPCAYFCERLRVDSTAMILDLVFVLGLPVCIRLYNKLNTHENY